MSEIKLNFHLTNKFNGHTADAADHLEAKTWSLLSPRTRHPKTQHAAQTHYHCETQTHSHYHMSLRLVILSYLILRLVDYFPHAEVVGGYMYINIYVYISISIYICIEIDVYI